MTSPAPLTAKLEAVLFVAAEPLSVKRLAAAVGADISETKTALATLAAELHGGTILSELNDRYRLVTAPAVSITVRQFLQDESKTELSRPALETLAVVAYRGPITRSAIEAVRGVSSEGMLRNLLARGLIREAGKSPEPGRPLLYAISHTFLQHFGLASTRDLPPLPNADAADQPDPEPVGENHAH